MFSHLDLCMGWTWDHLPEATENLDKASVYTWQSQSKNNTQLSMWLVTVIKSDAAKSNTALKPGRLGPWIKLKVVKQEMARVDIILGISELKWTRMGEFNLDDHYTYYCG